MKKVTQWLMNPPVTGQSSMLIIRLLAGSVFLWEGILKFVYTNQGVGRFTKLGFPIPEAIADFVAISEIAGGVFLFFGLFTVACSKFYFSTISS